MLDKISYSQIKNLGMTKFTIPFDLRPALPLMEQVWRSYNRNMSGFDMEKQKPYKSQDGVGIREILPFKTRPAPIKLLSY